METTRSERRETLIMLAICPWNLRHNEPLFRHWHRVPQKSKEILKQLKSDDIKNDNWHLRK